MRVLLDECVPRPLRRLIQDHDVRTVGELGWGGKKNGELLSLMKQHDFDVFITVDQSLPYEQNLRNAGVSVVILRARSNSIVDLEPLAPALRSKLDSVVPGALIHVDAL